MASNSNPNTWVPYMNMKDCSQGFCSTYCPQWCYIVISPPPPLELPGDGDSSKPNFSPLVIAIIGIFASAFLLVSYYTLISKYCGNRSSGSDASRTTRIDRNLDDPDENSIGNHDPFVHEPWQGSNTGLDDSLIKLITLFKYKKQDGLVMEGTDCSICLGEFKEDESLRMLPKCSHAFHVSCIDKWLKSHSNCPLCRANIILPVSCSPSPSLLLPAQETEGFIMNLYQYPQRNVGSVVDRDETAGDHQWQDIRRDVIVEESEINTLYHQSSLPKSPVRAFIDPEIGDTIIEIKDGRSKVRRSVSMDYVPQPRQLSIADVIRMNQDELEDEECSSKDKTSNVALSCSNLGNRIRDRRITDPMAIKRSFSSGRLFPVAQGRRNRNLNLPV